MSHHTTNPFVRAIGAVWNVICLGIEQLFSLLLGGPKRAAFVIGAILFFIFVWPLVQQLWNGVPAAATSLKTNQPAFIDIVQTLFDGYIWPVFGLVLTLAVMWVGVLVMFGKRPWQTKKPSNRK